MLTLSSQIHLVLNSPNAAVIEAEHGVITNDPREIRLDHAHLTRVGGDLQSDEAVFYLGRENQVERVLATGNVSPPDSFTYTIAGKVVPEFEGFYEVGLALIWQALGYGGLKLLKSILVALPLVLLAIRLKQLSVPWHHVLAALVVAILLLIPSWNLRPL